MAQRQTDSSDYMRPCRGYNGRYYITRDGEVWRPPHTNARGARMKGKWMTPHRGPKVWSMCLSMDGERTIHTMQSLVLDTFVGPRPCDAIALHIDGDITNNRLVNLRWGTKSEMSTMIVKRGVCFLSGGSRMCRPRGESTSHAKLCKLDVRWMRYLRNAGVTPKDLASVYGVNANSVYRVCSGRTWKHVS